MFDVAALTFPWADVMGPTHPKPCRW